MVSPEYRVINSMRLEADVPLAPNGGRSDLLPARTIASVCSRPHGAGMSKRGRLWARYWGIRDDHGNGHRMPILRHLALVGILPPWSS